jgi:hypothetical protein
MSVTPEKVSHGTGVMKKGDRNGFVLGVEHPLGPQGVRTNPFGSKSLFEGHRSTPF